MLRIAVGLARLLLLSLGLGEGRTRDRQLAKHDTAYVTGTGGVMSEQAALVLVGE